MTKATTMVSLLQPYRACKGVPAHPYISTCTPNGASTDTPPPFYAANPAANPNPNAWDQYSTDNVVTHPHPGPLIHPLYILLMFISAKGPSFITYIIIMCFIYPNILVIL